MNKLFFAICLLAIVSFSFMSCNDEKDMANVMVVHASPDAPGVDLLVDDEKVNSAALTYPNNTGYLSVEAGERNFKVNASGTTTTVINNTTTVEKDMNYTIYAVGLLANIEPFLTADDLTAPASGKAHVRFIHLSPTAPAVDVALDGGNVVFGNIGYKTATGFTPLDAGAYDLEVRVAGTSAVALDLDPITLEAGKIYTVFAKGLLTGTDAQALGAEIIVNN